jgi:hypothetical protein
MQGKTAQYVKAKTHQISDNEQRKQFWLDVLQISTRRVNRRVAKLMSSCPVFQAWGESVIW